MTFVKYTTSSKGFLQILLLAAVYFFTAKLGFTLTLQAEQVTAVWPPTGIALAAVLLFGINAWPGVALGAFLANITNNEPLSVALGITIGNTLEAVVGAMLLKRFAYFDNSLNRIKDVLSLVAFSVIISTTISATIGVTSLCLGGLQPWSEYNSLWLLWWLGDATGAMIVAPLLLTFGNHMKTLGPKFFGTNTLEAVALLTGLGITTFIIFVISPDISRVFICIVFPFIIWSAIRFTQCITSLVIFVSSSVAVWATVEEYGPFNEIESLDLSLMLLQAFMAMVAGTGLFLGAAIAERKEAENDRENFINKLISVNGELEQFAYAASHDLQEPLRLVRSFTKILGQEYKDKLDATAQEYIKISIDEAARMQELISSLLEYARLGSEAERYTQVDCNMELQHVLESFGEVIKKYHAEITHDRLPTITGIPVQFSRLIQNLLGNALKYQRGGAIPKIHIGVQESHDRWKFSVEDNGIGVSPEYFERIFLPFKRLHSRELYQGSGMGLAICKKIVENFGGKVWVESELGIGSKFYFTIPKS